jgi:hypothetical protein
MLRKHTISGLAPILLLVGSLKGAVNFNQVKLKFLRMADTHNSQNNSQHTVRHNMELSQVRQLLEYQRLIMEVKLNLVAV